MTLIIALLPLNHHAIHLTHMPLFRFPCVYVSSATIFSNFLLSFFFSPPPPSTVNFLDSRKNKTGVGITAGDVQVDLYRVISVLRVCLIRRSRTCGNIARVGNNWVWLRCSNEDFAINRFFLSFVFSFRLSLFFFS